jgi:hypothetical protein
MHKILLTTAFAAAMATQAWAQAGQPGAVNPPTGTPANANATASGLRVGMAVNDSTGLTVGKLSELKPDATGKPFATLQLGAETVTVEADRLTVRGQVASINATQAELKAMAVKPKS